MPHKPFACFVTGTDTGVGKTLVTAALLCAARSAGLSTIGLKPVAAGCEHTPEGLRNDDALMLQQYTSVPLSYQQINPVALAQAIAPHIAAASEQRRVDAARLEGLCRGVLMQRADLTLIEGAGGWRVPINPRQYLSDLVRLLDIPVLLVVGIRLGCISHALLSAEAIRADGLRLLGWVANEVDSQMPCIDDNVQAIEERIGAPLVGRIGWLEGSGPVAAAAACLDINRLLPG